MRSGQDGGTAQRPAPGEVHVFRTRLDVPDETYDAAWASLSPDEAARADAFARREHRERFVAARAWLRRTLGALLAEAPETVAFTYGPQGKPALARPRGLDFNLGHSGDHALLAVSPGFAVGVDIEEERFVEDKVAERFFSPAERRSLLAHAPAERQAAFFRCWTRKEAYLKALGSGLAAPLDGFTVSLAAGEAALLDVAGAPDEPPSWQMADLAPAPGLAAALAARRRGWRVVHEPNR